MFEEQVLSNEAGEYLLNIQEEISPGINRTVRQLNIIKGNWYSMIPNNVTKSMFLQVDNVCRMVNGKIYIKTLNALFREGTTDTVVYIEEEIFHYLQPLSCEPTLLECMLIGTDKLKDG